MRVAVLRAAARQRSCVDACAFVPRIPRDPGIPEIDITVEEQTMLREFVHVAVLGPKLDAVHALVHDVLYATPSPEPTALHDRGFLH